ncbi:hypothetical protein LABALGNA3A7_05400 [Dellaglioa algida]|nr:hypothetical protein LABALGNA3A7_05400 [Dellaglioa algida]
MTITYTKAKRELNDLGLIIGEDLSTFIIYTKNSNAVAIISKTIQYELDSLNFNLDELDKDSRKYVAKITWELAATPIDEREEPKRYCVQFVEGDDDSFLLRDMKDGELFISMLIYDDDYKIEFTKAEIMAINPNYMLFAVPVEEIDNE